MAKEPQELKWIEDLLPEEGYRRKSMFGGFAYYINERLVLLSFENPGDNSYRDQVFDFEVWNGCMFPVEHEHHEKARKLFPFLLTHPVLAKWLYLPVKTEGFDDLVTEVIAEATRPNGFWGSFPKSKSKKEAPKNVSEKFLDKISTKIDTRRPRMFSDEPAEVRLQSAEKISDLKNLGPVLEKQFHQAGIKTPKQFIQLGWKKALLKLIKLNPRNRHSIYAYVLIGALTNKEYNRISEAEKQEARDFVHALAREAKAKATKKPKLAKKTVKKISKKSS